MKDLNKSLNNVNSGLHLGDFEHNKGEHKSGNKNH
jgi:hypothetical protein